MGLVGGERVAVGTVGFAAGVGACVSKAVSGTMARRQRRRHGTFEDDVGDEVGGRDEDGCRDDDGVRAEDGDDDSGMPT